MQSSHNAANSFYCIVGGVIKASCAALMKVLLAFVPNPSGSFSSLMSFGSSCVVTTREANSVVSTVPPTRVLEKLGMEESFKRVKFTLLVKTGSSNVKTSWFKLSWKDCNTGGALYTSSVCGDLEWVADIDQIHRVPIESNISDGASRDSKKR